MTLFVYVNTAKQVGDAAGRRQVRPARKGQLRPPGVQRGHRIRQGNAAGSRCTKAGPTWS